MKVMRFTTYVPEPKGLESGNDKNMRMCALFGSVSCPGLMTYKYGYSCWLILKMAVGMGTACEYLFSWRALFRVSK